MPQFLSTTDAGFEAAFTALLGAKREDAPDVDAAVAAIIADVRDGAPPLRQALTLTVNSSSGLSWPDFRLRKMTASVISLLMLAGGIAVSASFS